MSVPEKSGVPLQNLQYTMQGAPMPVTVYPEPPHPSPHSYLAVVLFTLAFCLFWNITSVAFGIPALIFSVKSISASTNNKWKKAERYGQLALFFTMATWGYVGLTALVILGAVLGDYLSNYNFD